MEQVNQTDENELQKAINNITNSNVGGSVDAVVAGVEEAQVGSMAPGVDFIEAPVAEEAPAGLGAPVVPDAVMAPTIEMGVENQGLADVKARALSDLKPILEHVDLPAEDKFKVYKDIIGSGGGGDVVAPAYNVAKMIADEKERAEALLFIVKTIDDLGAGA